MGVSLIAPLLQVSITILGRVSAAITLAVAGLGFSLAGVVSFRRARMTINPTKPDAATSLVDSGIYRMTQNPMHLDILFILVTWATLPSSACIAGAHWFRVLPNPVPNSTRRAHVKRGASRFISCTELAYLLTFFHGI